MNNSLPRRLPTAKPNNFAWEEERSRPSLRRHTDDLVVDIDEDEEEDELEKRHKAAMLMSGSQDADFRSSSPVYPPEAADLDIETVDEDINGLDIDDLLEILLEEGGSDLHLSAKSHPRIRVSGDVRQLDAFPVLSGDQIRAAIFAIMSEDQQKKFENELELDFAHELAGSSRFRVNVFKQQENVGVVMRVIPWEIKSIEELNLPDKLNEFAMLPRGLVLVTGPTGSGKSTTLAAIIDKANRTRADHIMTIEDPIEFVHQHQKSIVNQREVGVDTYSFANALKRVLRQDPDIILVGEMRDLETISIALTAAETGHLVFGTLHTQSAKETITRVVDVFPEGAKSQVRTQLAATLQAVVCQTLLKKRGGGRVAALEIMIANSAIRAQIRDDKLHMIESTMQTSTDDGMQTLTAVLVNYVKSGVVDYTVAYEKCPNQKDFVAALGGEEGVKRIQKQFAQSWRG